ncbi:hypothetical protein Tcan_00793, partial [Toxocara canis]
MFGALLFLLASSAEALRCWYCDGERIYDESWITHASKCCIPRVVHCASASTYCLVAHVEGASTFWISGCNDDEFLGCDTHRIPFNSTLTRCQCNTDLCNPIQRIPNCAATRRSANQITMIRNVASSLRKHVHLCYGFCVYCFVLLRLNLNLRLC